MSFFVLMIFLIGGLSLSCKGSTTSSNTEGDPDQETVAEQDDEQATDPDPVDQADLADLDDAEVQVEEDPDPVEHPDRIDEDPSIEGDQPTDQVDEPEDDLVDPPDETDTGETDTTETDPTTFWVIFEGFVSGGGHAASSQYKLQFGRVGGAVAPGSAQSTNYRISGGVVSGQ